jgi:RimJ/RimL family protein N-acetyltransferase
MFLHHLDATPASLLRLDDGRQVRLRQVGPGDREGLRELYSGLSADSRRRRFLGAAPGLTPKQLRYLTDLDHVEHEAVAAIDPRTGTLIAEGRYAPWPGRDRTADVAIVVADTLQGLHLGSALAADIVERARRNGVRLLTASTLAENAAARAILSRLGFRTVGRGRGVLDLELALA